MSHLRPERTTDVVLRDLRLALRQVRRTPGFAVLGLVAIAIGLVLALVGARALRAQLLGVSPSDPLTVAAITTGLVVVVVAACAIPALRAGRVDPVRALRSE